MLTNVESGFSDYLRKIESYPILSEEEEGYLVNEWCSNKCIESAQKLVLAHMKLVVKIAMKFRNYGLAMMDLISEGNIGLMKAVKNFNPKYKCRVSTYAQYWISASISNYVLKTWSLVKIGTTVAQRKLFFNLRKLKNKILSTHGGDMALEKISEQLLLPLNEVKDMDSIMCNKIESIDDSEIASKQDNPETLCIANNEKERQKLLLIEAINSLNERQKYVFQKKYLTEKPLTLAELSETLGVSGERVRQIAELAMKKVKDYISEHTH